MEEDDKELKEIEKVTENFLEKFSEDDDTITDEELKKIVTLKTPKDGIKAFLLTSLFLLMGLLFIIFPICSSFNISNLTEFNSLKIDIAEYGFKWFLSGIDWNEYALLIVTGIIFVLIFLYGFIYAVISTIKYKKKKSVL